MVERQGRLPILDYVTLILFAVAASAVLLVSTSSGVSLSSDSFNYIQTAQNLLTGNGLIMTTSDGRAAPFVHYPPLYPTILAAVGASSLELVEAARWINVFCFAGSVVLVGLMARISVKNRSWLVFVSCLLMLTSINMIKVFSFALTEPLFIFFVLASLFALSLYLKTSNRRDLVISASFVALATLDRYIGVTMVGSGILVLLFLQSRGLRRKLADALIFFSVSVLPISIYLARNAFLAGNMTNRRMIFHPIPVEKLLQFLDTTSNWVIPVSLPLPLRLLALASFVILSVIGFIWVRSRRTGDSEKVCIVANAQSMSFLTLAWIFTYIVSLAVSLSFFDAATPLNYRILAPLFPACLILVISLLGALLCLVDSRHVVHTLATAFCFVFVTIYSMQGVRWTINHVQRDQDYNYNSKAWKQSELLVKLSDLPSNMLVYTNEPQAVHFHLKRPARSVPVRFHSVTNQANARVSNQLLSMGEQITNGTAVLAYFRIYDSPELLPEEEIVQLLSLDKLEETGDGAIYGRENR